MILPEKPDAKATRWEAQLVNGAPLEIRPLDRGELERLVRHLIEPTEALEALTTELEVPDGAATARGSVLVAWTQGVPIGRVCVRWSGPLSAVVAEQAPGVPEIHGLHVSPELRSQGIGAALLRAAEELALEREHSVVGLSVADENRGRTLYTRSGYRSVPGLPGYFETYEHRISPARPARVRERREFWTKRFPRPTLVLFDIDGTLLTSQGAGREAMLSAGKRLFGEAFEFAAVEVNGRLDPLIWNDLARANGLEPTPELERRFRECYREQLRTRLQRPGVVQALPGVTQLVSRLRATTGVTLGILSGNYPETGRMKLRAGGLDPTAFRICAWGDDAPARPGLVPVARGRYRERVPHALEPAGVVVIGDTPHDVDCALAHGCRALGVATGRSTREELLRCGAHRAEDTLADWVALADWILDPSHEADSSGEIHASGGTEPPHESSDARRPRGGARPPR